MESMEEGHVWIVVLGFIVAFFLALGLGANDVANSFGTSVGSKVLTLKGACIIATICETSGAVLAGGRVTDTIRGKIIEVQYFKNGTESEVLVGSLSTLAGSALWMTIATAAKLPVSSTHSIVGAMMGFGLVAFGGKAIRWKVFGKIASSWLVSPILSGSISSIFYLTLQHFVLNKPDSYHTGLKALPFIYFIILSVNIFAVFYNGSEVLRFNTIPLYGCLILSLGSGLVVGLVAHFLVVPHLRKKIDKEFESGDGKETPMETVQLPDQLNNSSETKISLSTSTSNLASEESSKLLHDDCAKMKKYVEGDANEGLDINKEKETSQEQEDAIVDDPKTARLLAFVQILTASFASFAHGSNDVSNAIAPLVSLWLTFKNGRINTELHTPIWILFYGGVGISLGLWIWGRRVIETIGEELSFITPSSGLIIEFGTVFTVLLASNLGIPISTTHCLVGAVVLVGLVRSRGITDWKVFRNILFAWIVTVPISGLLSAAVFAALRHTV